MQCKISTIIIGRRFSIFEMRQVFISFHTSPYGIGKEGKLKWRVHGRRVSCFKRRVKKERLVI